MLKKSFEITINVITFLNISKYKTVILNSKTYFKTYYFAVLWIK